MYVSKVYITETKKSILGLSYLEFGQRKQLFEGLTQLKSVSPVFFYLFQMQEWIAPFCISLIKLIEKHIWLITFESGWINYNFRKVFCLGPVKKRTLWFWRDRSDLCCIVVHFARVFKTPRDKITSKCPTHIIHTKPIYSLSFFHLLFLLVLSHCCMVGGSMIAKL